MKKKPVIVHESLDNIMLTYCIQGKHLYPTVITDTAWTAHIQRKYTSFLGFEYNYPELGIWTKCKTCGKEVLRKVRLTEKQAKMFQIAEL